MQTVRTNMKIGASSQYSNFDFNSMCLFGETLLGAGPGGLFKACCGDTDAGSAPISATFKTRIWNLGHIGLKRIRFVYVEVNTAADMLLKITADEEHLELDVVPVKTGWQRIRVPVPRIAGQEYFDFEFSNTDGGAFKIGSISGLVVTLAG